MIGTTLLNRYKIDSELGKGGMGVVYKAHDTLLHRTVAIKFLNTDGIGTEGRSRLIQEARAVAQLNHPNIVSVFDAGETEGNPFIVMEFVPGNTLKGIAAPSVSESLVMAAQICKALDHAHSKGIIHRDLKLENIIVTDMQTLKLMDFGLARTSDDSRMTEEGVLKGTLAYIAPELIQGEPASAQSDLYAFGVILYELLTGHTPFQGTVTVVLSQHLNGIVTPPSEHNQQVPAWVDALVLQLLAKHPEERPVSAKDVLLALEGQSTAPVVSISPKSRNNLPTNLSKFIGREKEIAEVNGALSEYRLVTLTGSGGVGKTRLSLQVATELLDQFPNGTWFVELAPITDPDLIPQVILTAADMQTQQGRSALDSLTDFLREKTSLLVLDNCEHLIEACAKLADTLLNAAPNLKILASSREALGVKGEQAWHVPSLSIPDLKHLPAAEQLSQYEAVRLFMDRAVLAQPHFAVTNENANAVAQICSRLDGIPLAIELAAARIKVLKAEQIAERLNDRFRLLTGGSRTALPRQQTLRALIDWSYDLLAENEKLLLRRLAVFMGGWTLEAAEQVCSDGQLHAEDVLDLLIHLVDKSLVVVDEQPAHLRYRMLETVRQYAREKLLESGEGEKLHTQHLVYFLKFAEEAEPHLFRAEQIEWLDRLELDDDNLRAALDWAVDDPQNHPPEAALRLCNALWFFWFVRGYWSYGQEWLERALSKPSQSRATVARGQALGHFVYLAWADGLDSQVLELPLEESLEIGNVLRDRQDVAYALYLKGMFAWNTNNAAAAKTFFSESLSIYREINHQWGLARVLFFFGQIYVYRERDYPAASRYYKESLQISRQLGERRGMSVAFNILGELAMKQGDWAGARSLFEQSLSLSRELGDKQGICMWMTNISMTLLAQGVDHASGKSLEELLAESLTIARELGSKFAIASTLEMMGRVARFQNNYTEAIKLQTESLKYGRGINDKDRIIWSLLWLGELARLENDYVAAHSYLLEALSAAKETDFREI
ncbi:MAG: protein kinase, partial [Anaerolineales bacterium]|nr:protein kinase [Anaerolineales bacterium]